MVKATGTDEGQAVLSPNKREEGAQEPDHAAHVEDGGGVGSSGVSADDRQALDGGGRPPLRGWRRAVRFAVLGAVPSVESNFPPRNEARYTAATALLTILLVIGVGEWNRWVLIGITVAAAVSILLSINGALSAAAFDRHLDTKEGYGYGDTTGERHSRAFHGVSAFALARAVTEPHHYYRRIKQSLRQLTLAFEVETQYTISLGLIDEFLEDEETERLSSVYVPVVLARKGVLHDDLEISWKGNEIPTATFEESLEIVRQAIRSLAHGSEKLIDAIESDEAWAAYDAIEDQVMRAAALRRPALPHGNGHSTQRTEEALAKAVEAVGEVETFFGKDSYTASVISEIVTTLSTNYYIFAVLPLGEINDDPWLVFQTRERQILASRTAARPSESWFQLWVADIGRYLSQIYGLRPGRIEYPTYLATLCSSYHLHIMGSEGTYLWRQRVDVPRSYEFRYRRFRSRRGQRYLHLYLRGVRFLATSSTGAKQMHEHEGDEVTVTAVFRERVPGAFPPAVVAASVSVVVLGLAWLHKSPNDLSVFGLLLAAPGAMVAYSGFVSAVPHRLGAALAPRVSRSITMVLTLAGLGMYVGGLGSWPVPTRLNLPCNVSLEPWQVLAQVALANTLMTTLAWIKAGLVHASFLDYKVSEFFKRAALDKWTER